MECEVADSSPWQATVSLDEDSIAGGVRENSEGAWFKGGVDGHCCHYYVGIEPMGASQEPIFKELNFLLIGASNKTIWPDVRPDNGPALEVSHLSRTDNLNQGVDGVFQVGI